MPAFTYTAKRSLINGHVIDTVYSIDINARSIARSSSVKSKTKKSLGGQTETIVQSRDINWSISLNGITELDLPAIREFLDSVDAGESFVFDPYGTVAIPDNPISVKARAGYTESRQGFSDYFVIGFGVYEI